MASIAENLSSGPSLKSLSKELFKKETKAAGMLMLTKKRTKCNTDEDTD